MKRFAVAYINFFDNDLKVKVVEVSAKGKKIRFRALLEAFPEQAKHIQEHDDAIEEAKEEAFNQDWLFEVVEIPS